VQRYCFVTENAGLVAAARLKGEQHFVDQLDLGDDRAAFRRIANLSAFDTCRDAEAAIAPSGASLVQRIVAQFAVPDTDAARNLHDKLTKRGAFCRDPSIAVADAWFPSGVFGDRRQADRLIGAAALADCKADGAGVNVVIADGGLSGTWLRNYRRTRNLGGEPQQVHGWSLFKTRWSGTENAWGGTVWRAAGGQRSAHAEMIVRNVLALAPRARIWDLPLIADGTKPPGVSLACSVFDRIRWAVKHRMFNGTLEAGTDDPGIRDAFAGGQRWVIVNAWGVFNSGLPGLALDGVDYGDDPRHPLLAILDELQDLGIDVVFCATNCGDPCPDGRCGHADIGPGRSIMGLNAHPAVLTVGEVRVDGVPIGQSSQGPGRLWRRWKDLGLPDPDRAREKPDLCAPSHFHEVDDAAAANLGTSAATGVAGGVIAALRSIDAFPDVSPCRLRAALRRGASQATGVSKWHPRLGHGIINIPATITALQSG
jgi:hypothetical protein